jgi:hypothetical protein
MTGPLFQNQQQQFFEQQRERQRQQAMALWYQQQRQAKQAQTASSATVDPRFSRVEQELARLRQQMAAGRLTASQFEAQLRDLMIRDSAGAWWMIGSQTNQWYRFDGREWVPAERPTIAAGDPRAAEPLSAGRARPVRAVLAFVLGLAMTVILAFAAAVLSYNVLLATDFPQPEEASLAAAGLIAVSGLVMTWRRARRWARGF